MPNRLRLNLAERFLFPPAAVNPARLFYALTGKTVVITGASYGIGREVALLFSAFKTHLVLIARTEEKLQDLAHQAQQNGARCTIITADLYQEAGADRVIDALLNLPGGIDIFISNAGKSIMRGLEQSLGRYHDFTRTNALNYLAPVKILLAVTPALQKSNGQIINVSALNVLLLPAPKWAAYQASKTAFDQWMRCNLPEWKIMGITAKTIYLPLVRTKMIAPNAHYKNYPAMQPRQAAIRIAKLVCSGHYYSKPWWAVFAQAGSFFGRRTWQWLAYTHLKKQNGNAA